MKRMRELSAIDGLRAVAAAGALSTVLRTTWSNPLYLLIVAQALYILAGTTVLEFNVSFLDVLAALIAAAAAEYVFGGSRLFPASGMAAALGIGIFFRATSPWYFALAAFLAIASKYFIRIRGKHIFNPSNFAIVVSVLAFPASATIEFTQWGPNIYVYMAIAAASFFIAYRAGVIVTTASFLIAYSVLLVLFISRFSGVFAAHHYGILGPSFVLFASFMITDPKTSPQEFPARILHGIAIACCYFLLELWGVRYALFIATFIISVLNGASRFAPLSTLRWPWIQGVRQNIISTVVILALFAYFAAPILGTRSPSAVPNIPWQFIVFGIGGNTDRQCTNDRVFIRHPESGIEMPAWTKGAAWGDYDNDGDDDIFVSDFHVVGKLYRNNGDGTFSDVTAAAGLPHEPSASAFFADFDNDADLDLFIVPVNKLLAEGRLNFSAFRNNGGTYADATRELGLAEFSVLAFQGTLSFADYNNDGFLDFVYATPGYSLYVSPPSYKALQKAMLDPFFPKPVIYKCDAALEELIPEIERLAAAAGNSAELESFRKKPMFCAAVTYALSPFNGSRVSESGPITSVALRTPGSVHLFENQGGTHFVEHPEFWQKLQRTYPLDSDKRPAEYGQHPFNGVSWVVWQPVSFDLTGDHLPDIFISLDNSTNLFLVNKGGFSFDDATEQAGIDYAGSGMGTDVGNISGTHLPDVISDNSYSSFLFKNNGDGTFSNLFRDIPFATLGTAWGISFLDYNLDGWDDVYIAVGDENNTSSSFRTDLTQPYFREDKLYANRAGRTFDDVSGDMCPDAYSGMALALSDYDDNGTPDVFIGNLTPAGHSGVLSGSSNFLMRNTTVGKHFVKVRLVGRTSNRMGIGASVRVRHGSHAQTKFVLLGNSFYSQNSSTLIFGLDLYSGPYEVDVVWPSGKRTTVRGESVDTTLTIKE